jgi:inhibitor of KinA sporulation pathway (predicted exonuclease)
MSKKKPKTETKRATWGEMLTREELLALLDRLDQKKLARKQMSEEVKKSKNPFINLANAAKAVAANPRVPGSKTTQVQTAKHGGQVSTNKPAKKSAGRGR